MLQCSKCKEFKDESCFYKNSRSKTGYKTYCKECDRVCYGDKQKLRNKRNYYKDLEGSRKRVRERRIENIEQRRDNYNKRSKENREYNIFRRTYYSLKRRCNNPNDIKYSRYGGRGIKCLRNTLDEFKKDMRISFLKHIEEFGTGRKNCQIDRVDNDGHYCKENCRRVTCKENNSFNHAKEFSS